MKALDYFSGRKEQYELLDSVVQRLSLWTELPEEAVIIKVYTVLMRNLNIVRLSLKQAGEKDSAWRLTFVMTCAEDFARMFEESKRDAVVAEVVMEYKDWLAKNS